MALPVPVPTPLTRPYWDGCAHGELRLQHCASCAAPFFPPQARCPRCRGADLEWAPVSGRATLYSYLIQHRPAPGFEDRGPYAVAVVELAEGPRMMTNIVDIPNTPEDLVLDMALQVRFEERDDIHLPVFAPAGTAP
ncbi:Zn-ribbon domain-containing OB-fold protein [Cryptosporangium sp. NPDC051539]|uniref:Zn-ribbon domain-containing OB-fold protein n=1 Tax=Cryptosporangium sp. NPDC051539 TaxID=3363962 RepID=UPI0037B3F2AB